MKVNEVKEIILNCEKLERRFVMLRNGRIEAYEIERDDKTPKVGDIYLGRIVNLDSMLQAAFVDIGAQKNAFLHYHDMLPGNSGLIEQYRMENEGEPAPQPGETLSVKRRKRQAGSTRSASESERRNRRISASDIPNIFKPGTEILVQVVKAPISTKGARVTTDISIPGRFLVLMPYCEHLGLSTRIEGGAERERLRKILAELELPEGMGLICRTVGAGRKSGFFKNDLDILLHYWYDIEKAMESAKAPSLLFTEPNLIERSVRDFLTEDFSGVVVDDKEAYKEILSRCRRRSLRTVIRLPPMSAIRFSPTSFISTVSAFSSPSIWQSPSLTKRSAETSPVQVNAPLTSTVFARSALWNFAAPEASSLPCTVQYPSTVKEPEQSRLPASRLPVILVAPEQSASPSQTTSPNTLPAPEMSSEVQRRFPSTFPAPLMSTFPYSPPGIVLAPETSKSIYVLIVVPLSDSSVIWSLFYRP